MAKTANLVVRIDPELKEEAERILSGLGMSASGAITMFYKQIILNNGLPFEVRYPDHPLDISKMSEEELVKALEDGLRSAKEGKSLPADEVFEKIAKDYGL